MNLKNIKKPSEASKTKGQVSPVPKSAKAAANKASIVMAARKCFEAKGLFDASMDDIQAAANTSRGSLYYHFKSKEEILQTVIDENLGALVIRINQIIQEAAENNCSFEQIMIELVSLTERITFGPGKGMAFHCWSYSMVNEEICTIMMKYFALIRQALEKEIKALQKLGRLPKTIKASEAASLLFGLMISGFSVQRNFLGNKSIDPKTYIKTIISVFGALK